ncbi:hypothetical protein [Streptomyces sp. NRRL S-495]|uniref:hypothetical protein n=1 Tax=Streptomyces sp. NRRL S-495 TaxID=1609133 RepID=UPI0005F8FC98|nr:hypothetical protein [Streptomyces sp. NRRL S-495]KJY25435.1 hypothetical protein VR45_39330 [Streptomyces sp. NRRL S-495]
MRFPWCRRPAAPPADTDDDLQLARLVAYRAAQRDHPSTVEILALGETALEDENGYAFAVGVLENLQNLASHGLDAFRSPEDIRPLLGPRSAICWDSLTDFWHDVADWRLHNGAPMESSAPLLAVENEELRLLLWTSNRTLPTGEKLGIADVVRYEKAVGASLPGYSHLAMALSIAGEGSS